MSGSSAAAMTNRARECGLDVFYCNPTLGDGNCWYRAIVDQIHRKSVYNRISEGLRFTDVGLLRVQVLNYIRMNEKEFEFIRERSEVYHIHRKNTGKTFCPIKQQTQFMYSIWQYFV